MIRLSQFVRPLLLVISVATVAPTMAAAQGLGGAGTIQGTVKDPTGGVMVSVSVVLTNPVTGFNRTSVTDSSGQFAFRNLPPNPYHLEINAQGFAPFTRDIDVRSSVPIDVGVALAVATQSASVEVVGTGQLVERDPTAHTDIDQSLLNTLPVEGTSSLNQVITLASPGVVADANGFFHPVGDHAQTQFSIDNQPVTDQQSRVYSNQISPDAVQSMEVITGVPQAEFGDKDSLVVRIITKSGLDQAKPTGAFSAGYGSFKSPTAEISLGVGRHEVGNFLSYSGTRSDRFLDPPEFDALHGNGNLNSFFDRIDGGAFHLNVQAAHSSFDVPNTIDQDSAGQDQHQKIDSFNVAPGYTKALNGNWLFAANAYVRRDHLVYTPSGDPFADSPATVSQDRKLTNYGVKVDLSYVRGVHNVKVGGSIVATKLDENFTLGVTDPTLNTACVNKSGDPVVNAILDSSKCAAAGLVPNDAFLPDLAPFDLTRPGGKNFVFAATDTIKSQAGYVQDAVTAGPVTLNLGLRLDHYDGLTTKTSAEPRLGVALASKTSGTVVRASYGRTLETPYNENLLLSASNVFGGGGTSLPPGVRDHFEAGVQQAFGKWLVADVGYFKKKTTNAYDFGVLFDTPIAFPISWDHSNLDGFTARVNLVEHRGFSAFTVMAHTNAIFFLPQTGGLFPETATEGSFRIDHDQKFNQTTNIQYEYAKPVGAWVGLTWRYDSGLVAGSVPDYATALTLSGDQQAAIGLFCNGTFATPDVPLSSCASANRGATRLKIPADGTEDDVTNPPRIAPRHLVDLGFGVDNLFHGNGAKVRLRFTVLNVTNKEALYNFLSTFSGTHFVTPRAYQFQAGVSF
jgi:hypothetical protein